MATTSSRDSISLALPIELLGFHLAGKIGLRVFSIPVLDEPKPQGNSFQFGLLSYVPPQPFYILLERTRPSPDNFQFFSTSIISVFIQQKISQIHADKHCWLILQQIRRLKVIDSPNMYTQICYPYQTLHM